MGQLVLPHTGKVYVDTNTVIYAIEKIEPYSSFLTPLWTSAVAGNLKIITSELTWLETLSKPIKDGNTALENLFRAFLNSKEVSMIPATLPIWEEATKLRGLGLKTPDALHASTALIHGCDLFLTNDLAFQKVPFLPVTVLSVAMSV